MRNLFRIIALVCLLATCAAAQNYTTVSGSNITDGSGNKLTSGQICFLGVDGSNNPISYQVGGGGQALRKAVCASVATGAFSKALANTALTSPANVCFRVTVTDANGINVIGGSGYNCFQPTGPTYNFDNFAPNLVGYASLTPPVVVGPVTVNGSMTVNGAFNANSIDGILTLHGFGCLTDGSDQSTCLQTALTTAIGRTMWMDPGDYHHSATLKVGSGTILLSTGQVNTNPGVTSFGYTGTGNAWQVTTLNGYTYGVRLNGFRIYSTTGTAAACLDLDHVQESEVDHMVMGGVQNQGCGTGVNAHGISLSSVHDNIVSWNTGSAIVIDGHSAQGSNGAGPSSGNQWAFNNIFSNAHGFQIKSTDSSSFHDNYFEASDDWFYLDTSAGSYFNNQISMVNDRIENNQGSKGAVVARSAPHFFRVTGAGTMNLQVDGLKIEGNYFDTTGSTQAFLDDTTTSGFQVLQIYSRNNRIIGSDTSWFNSGACCPKIHDYDSQYRGSNGISQPTTLYSGFAQVQERDDTVFQVAAPILATALNGTQFADTQTGGDACAKIRAAVALLPSTGGLVDARNFTGDQTCTSGTLALDSTSKPVGLLLGDWRLISAANPVITVVGNSFIRGTGMVGGVGHSSVNSTTSGGTVILWQGSHGELSNLFLGLVGAGKGLYLKASGTNSVQNNEFRNVQINAGQVAGSIGVDLEAASATALVSHNNFYNVWAHDADKNIALTTSGTVGPTDNNFFDTTTQAFGSVFGTGVYIPAGALNNFYGGIASNLATGVDLENGTTYNGFFGMRTESNTANLVDNGVGTMLVGHSIDVATLSGSDTSQTYIGQGNVNTAQKLPASLRVNGGVQTLDTSCAANSACFAAIADPGTGISPLAADHSMRIASNGAYVAEFVGQQFRMGSAGVIGFASGADPTLASNDTAFSRGAAGLIDAGNGTQGDASATINAGGYQIGGVGTTGSGGLVRATNPTFSGITNASTYTWATSAAQMAMNVENGSLSLMAGTTSGTDCRALGFGSTHATNANQWYTDCDSFNVRSTAGVQRLSVTSAGVTSVGVYLAPDGAVGGPGFAFANEPTTGWYRAGANDVRLSVGSGDKLRIAGGQLIIPSSAALDFASTGVSASDTGISRTAPGVIAAGSGGAGNASGTYLAAAYQVAGIQSVPVMRVAADFTTTASTALQAITGLSFTIPATTAANINVHCSLMYSQAAGLAAVAFGIQDVSVAPTNIAAKGVMYTAATVETVGTLPTLTTTTATNIVSATPSAITTVWGADLDAMIEAPSNASSSVVQFMVSTATAGDAVTVKRGSYCRAW